ncbi:PLDc N-terminal domain-containing protein [Gilvimarinus xylanilyticus]|uniref:PLDc N-terminal domain-containing protein n=1 Tax=Gilvimarinus xylanilyticus TaxID=2944139 RepID=UPI003AF09ACE
MEYTILITTVVISLILWIIPISMIASSDRASRDERLAWILAVIFISWFAWIFYLLLAPVKNDRGR